MSYFDNDEHMNFKTIWSIGSTSSGAYTFNGTKYPEVCLPSPHTTCNPLFIGTDQENDIENIRKGVEYLISNDYGPVLLVNSIGYSIDGNKTETPGSPLKEVTETEFANTRLINKFSQVVKELEYENMFWVFNRNYSTQNGKMGGQWANVGYNILSIMKIPNYNQYTFIADVGGGSVTFYSCNGDKFTEYKNIKMFLNKKNKESPNMLYNLDPTCKMFVEKFKESISQYSEITTQNLLVLQTGKMREDNVYSDKNSKVELEKFPYSHYYLDNKYELFGEAMDLCNSITEEKDVKSINFYQSTNKNVINIIVNEPQLFDYIKSYIVSWYTYLFN
jgi:hypothetical protein